jgi:hypothetical protein
LRLRLRPRALRDSRRGAKGALGAAAVATLLVAVGAAALEHGRIAHAFHSTEAEALPAAYARPCGPVPALEVRAPVSFPHAGAVFTLRHRAGPTTVVVGYRHGTVGEANAAYRAALTAAGYRITRSEVDSADSEVAFAGARTSGQVKLTQECRDRMRLRITIRPS